MRKKTVAIISLGAFAALCWTLIVILCAFFTGYRAFKWAVKSAHQIVFVERADLESEPSIRILDANNPFFKVTRTRPKHINIEWGHSKINMKHPKCRVKQLAGTHLRVMGQLNGNKAYPVVIDTGNPKGLVVSDTVVADSQLDIYPMEELGSPFGGLCHVARIEIGNIAITNPMCHYMLSHYERRVLGRTIWKQRDILLGLVLIRKFVYVLIDNITGEVEFCVKGRFQSDPNESWSQYSMSIETDDQNQERLLVDMPIAGQARELVFDTGYGGGLGMTERMWEGFSDNLTVIRTRDALVATILGLEPCRDIIVEKLEVGGRSINNATIAVTVESESNLSRQESITLGMMYFKDTVVVLDFERGLMWVKNPQSR